MRYGHSHPVVFAKTRLDEGSRACFAHGPLLCRFKDKLPSAAVGCILSWGDRDVPSFADDVSMLAALLASHDHAICEVLLACTVAFTGLWEGHSHKQKRRRLNDDFDCCSNAHRHFAVGPGVPRPIMQSREFLQTLDANECLLRFLEAVAASATLVLVAPIRVAMTSIPAQTQIRLALQQLAGKTGRAIREGRAVCPRSGFLHPPREGKSLIVMTCSEFSLSDKDLLGPAHGKDSAVWIAPRDVLTNLPLSMDAAELFQKGVLRLLVGVGSQQRRLAVSPAVTDFDAEWALDAPGKPWDKRVPVIVYILQDCHQYRYVYDTFYRAYAFSTQSDCLSTFLGSNAAPTTSATLEDWFGSSHSAAREATIASMQVAMATVFTEDQHVALLTWERSLALLDSIPGGGKTFVLEGITVHVLQSHEPRKLVVAFRTQALAEQFADRIDAHAKRLDLQPRVARVGWDKDRWIEHFQQTVADRATAQCPTHMDLLALLDATITAVMQGGDDIEHTVVELLRNRCYLWEDLQHILAREKKAAAERITVLIVTTTYWTKLQAGHASYLERLFLPTDTQLGLLADEIQSFGFEEAAAQVCRTGWSLFAGDARQAPSQTRPHDIAGQTLFASKTSAPPNYDTIPLRVHPGASFFLQGALISVAPLPSPPPIACISRHYPKHGIRTCLRDTYHILSIF